MTAIDVFDIIKERRVNVLIDAMIRRLFFWLSDKVYLSLRFRCQMGYWMSWKNPRTFSEKLQWLKLYDRKEIYTIMVDKYSAKDFVENIIGKEYIIPTIGVWDSADSIDWDSLPEQFVLKTTHGGGNSGVVVCTSKKDFDKESAVCKLNNSMKSDIYRNLREWPYKNVRKRIIAEKYIGTTDKEDLVDYKFFCFDGCVHSVMVCVDRSIGAPKFYFYDKDWNLLPLNKRGLETDPNFKLPKPQNMDRMFKVASLLSKGVPSLRVDLYNVNGNIYFGELTFFPASGFDRNLLQETEVLFGDMITLPR